MLTRTRQSVSHLLNEMIHYQQDLRPPQPFLWTLCNSVVCSHRSWRKENHRKELLFFPHWTQMEHVFFPPLHRVAICGGTHGNEMSGVYMVREMQRKKVEKVGSVSITTILSNPPAVDVCRRYVDTDLNRSFTDALLRYAETRHPNLSLSECFHIQIAVWPPVPPSVPPRLTSCSGLMN